VSGGALQGRFWREFHDLEVVDRRSEGCRPASDRFLGDLTRRKGLPAGREGGRGEGEVIQGRGTSSLGAPKYVQIGSRTIDANDVWYFEDKSEEFLEKWSLLGTPKVA
jgi:hypothetical protein